MHFNILYILSGGFENERIAKDVMLKEVCGKKDTTTFKKKGCFQ